VLRDLVIIATSASVFDADRQQSLLAGCHAFLPKPIRAEQLQELLATHLGLVWQYEPSARVAPARTASAGAIPLAVPPPADLARLLELAAMGDLAGIRKHATLLAQQDASFGPFAHRLERLARAFAEEQIVALVEQYLETSSR
jgi:hypothetical protein